MRMSTRRSVYWDDEHNLNRNLVQGTLPETCKIPTHSCTFAVAVMGKSTLRSAFLHQARLFSTSISVGAAREWPGGKPLRWSWISMTKTTIIRIPVKMVHMILLVLKGTMNSSCAIMH